MRLTNRTAIVVALGTAQTLSWGSTYYLPAILALPIARDLGMPPSWFFAVFSGAMFLTAFLGPAVGRRIDLFGGRGVLAGTNVIFAAGLALLGCAQNLATVIAAWVLLGIGMGGGLYDAAFATLTSLYGRDARGPITGITLIAGLASTICWPITAVLDAEFGWRTACFVWAVSHLVLGLPLNLLLPTPAAPAARAAADEAPADGPAQRRAMYLLAFVFAAAWFVTGSMAAHLPRLLEAAGTSAAAAIAAAALVGPAQVAARLAEFGLMRRAHPLVSARMAASTHPIGALVFLAIGATPLSAAAFALLHGWGNGLLTIARGTLPLAIFGPVGYGRRTGILGAPARATQAASPLLFSLVLDGVGPTAALMLSSFLTLSALGGLMLLHATPRDTPVASAGSA